MIINSFVSVANVPKSNYNFISTIDQHSLYLLMKSHYYNGIKFLKDSKINSVVTNNNIIVNAFFDGDYSDDRVVSVPQEHIHQNVIYFKKHISDKLCAEGKGLNFDSFTCDFYTFMKFTQLYDYLNLSNWHSPEWHSTDINFTNEYLLINNISTSRVTREICAAFDIKFYYEDLHR